MNKLKGIGPTFSTSGKAWKPFRFNPKIAKQNAKRRRLINAGLAMTKDEASQLARQAIEQGHKIRKIPARKPAD